MFKIVPDSGVELQTPLGSLRRSPMPPSRYGFLAFGSRSFVPLALAIFPTHMFICQKLKNVLPSLPSRRLQHLHFCSPPICPTTWNLL